jgi:HisJ family histidinol phosphate phosphatase
MRVDYHVHTPYCGHAHGKIIHYIDSAIENGIQEIGFADHLGRYYLTPAQKRRYWDWGWMKENWYATMLSYPISGKSTQIVSL